jgi:hypothetical protein
MRDRREILGRGFRANPVFELILYDRLPAEERQALAELRKDPDFYGILRPREGAAALGVKSVDRETALLFLTLREPGPLPSYMEALLGDGAFRTAARLVADGILEVEHGGGFVFGAAALPVLGGIERGDADGAPAGRLAGISLAALRYGQDLDVDDAFVLSYRLYGYNRRPLTPRWKRLLGSGGGSSEAVLSWLGVGRGGRWRQELDRGWESRGPNDWWLSWSSRAPVDALTGSGATWKLYISPAPEVLPESFGAILEALAAARAPQFKIGADAWGLLRADKIVAYFPSFELLAAAADALASRLSGMPAQGVPFTSEIGGDGLLSWGVDPPREETALGAESWRLWLTHRLARALISAKSASRRLEGAEGAEPWRFALERVRLEGVDTDTWTPGAMLWKRN